MDAIVRRQSRGQVANNYCREWDGKAITISRYVITARWLRLFKGCLAGAFARYQLSDANVPLHQVSRAEHRQIACLEGPERRARGTLRAPYTKRPQAVGVWCIKLTAWFQQDSRLLMEARMFVGPRRLVILALNATVAVPDGDTDVEVETCCQCGVLSRCSSTKIWNSACHAP
ncbi:hypothetical protein LIA77_09596 [Sarocladium implicatum]|nr:hypothetical protein LIA77_09596 [Sarocladium implicatum]